MLALGANGRGRAGLLSALRPQDVFATSLYSGDGTSKKITLPFQPDLVWEKRRNIASRHILTDSARGPNVYLDTSATDAELSRSSIPGTFYSDGYAGFPFSSGDTAVGWALKQQAKFFVRVTYTGDGTSGRVIPHALGIKPGMIIVKRRDVAGNWGVWHTSATGNLFLNLTDAQSASNTIVLSADSNSFTVGNTAVGNTSGGTYVAYLFAHDPDTTNGIVQCGTYNTGSNATASINLGWRPQWLLIKAASGASSWYIFDDKRGLSTSLSSSALALFANDSAQEQNQSAVVVQTAAGFQDRGMFATNVDAVYMAIRAPIT